MQSLFSFLVGLVVGVWLAGMYGYEYLKTQADTQVANIIAVAAQSGTVSSKAWQLAWERETALKAEAQKQAKAYADKKIEELLGK
jgi:hypothetical protein